MGSKRFTLGRLALLSVVLFISVCPRLAAAQITPGVTLSAAGITHSIARDGFRTSNILNHRDCVDDDIVSFPLSLTNRGSYRLEVWVGFGCDELVNRTSSLAQCWRVFSELPLANSRLVSVPVRSMVAGYTSPLVNSANMNSDAGVGTLAQAGPEVCVQSDLSVVTPITVYFMLIDPSDEQIAGTSATWTGKFKLAGPPPPDEISAAAGAKSLVVHFAYDNNQSDDPTINGYTFYCDPAPGAEPLPAADAGTACDSSQLTVLMPGAVPEGANLCASAPLTAVSANIVGLQPGVPYRVAMAVADTFANLGPLSSVTCGVPLAEDRNVSACTFSPRRASRRVPFGLLGLTLAGWRRSRRRVQKRGAARSAPQR
jgi:hypothetical protein